MAGMIELLLTPAVGLAVVFSGGAVDKGGALDALTGAEIAETGGNAVEAVENESFNVKVICESDDVYQIYYSCYFDGEYYGMGGAGDYDGNALTAESDVDLSFTRYCFEGRDDVSGFSIDFAPYAKDATRQSGLTNRVYIAAQYGDTYTVVITGNAADGFTAELQG